MWDDESADVEMAIDDVAHELTAGSPRVDIRARVQARIDGAAASTRVHRGGWMAAAVAAVVIVVAVGVWRRSDRTLPVPPRQTAQQTAREQRTPAVERTIERVHVDARPLHKRQSPPDREHSASLVASLAPAPLTVDPLGVAPMEAVRSITLSEMNVSPIEVAPLPTDDRPR